MEGRIYNFSAGPATLPLPVLEQIQGELLNYPGAGASVMEISHRSKAFAEIHEQAKANVAALLNVPDNHKVLFLQGGATLQFAMIAMNFLRGGSADYAYVGSWAKKAIGEAKKFGTPRIAWSGEDSNFTRMPTQDELDLDPNAAYFHFTSNETIQGAEFFTEPETGNVPLICDASSDFMSRPLPIEKYGLLYAGAQKNVGPAGVCVVIVRDDLLERAPDDLAMIMSYKDMAEGDSLLNTPPCFAIYVVALVTQWLRDTVSGLDAMEQHNIQKAQLVYDAIDNSGGYYRGHAESASRSRMNVTFRLPSEDLEKKFIAEATDAGLDGLKGHRSVGGCRASIYNAMPKEGVEALCAFMADFKQANG